MDVLTDVLRTLRLKGTVYFQADFRSPWGMDIKGGAVANFHIVTRGECWFRRAGDAAPTRLGPGDVVVFPHGDRHALLAEPDGEALPAQEVLSALAPTETGCPSYGGAGPETTLICGHFECDRDGRHPLLGALPPTILIRAGGGPDPEWIRIATQLAVAESNRPKLGGEAVVDRIAEALLIQVIRAHADALDDAQGFLAAISDPVINRGLSLIHERPEHPWSSEELAHQAGASRTVFADRFRDKMGTSPIQYLTHWRMHKARELLRSGDFSVAQIAERVGYQSEWAFAKAFKRVFQAGPGAIRRAAKEGA